MDLGSSGTLTHMELVDMMQELKALKNFFEDTSQEASRIIPSLMISNSHCTFPLSLDSCQSFTLKPVANLANRRGRNPPPPLLLKNQSPSSQLPYPGLPTASLGSPSLYSDFPEVDISNTSGLRIEDMINNLRLQCSSMVINTPSVDNEPVKKLMEAESEFAASEPVVAESSIESTAFSANNASSDHRLVALTMPPGPQKGTSRSRVKAVNPDKIGTASKNLQSAKYAQIDTPDKEFEVLSKYSSPPLLLRSSLVKNPTFRPRSPKSVRFALSPLEFEKSVVSLMYDDVWRSSQVSAQDHYGNAPVKNFTVPHLNPTSVQEGEEEEESTHLIRQITKSWHPTSTTFKVSSKDRIKSILIKPPVRHSTVPNIFYGNTDKANDRPQRLLESRGRHSLNRIIKGPIFSSKEQKRATVSKVFSVRGDVTPDSVTLESIQRKSRMPVPLRNILTRFK